MKKLALLIMLTALVANIDAISGDEVKGSNTGNGSIVTAPQQSMTPQQTAVAQKLINEQFDSQPTEGGFVTSFFNSLFPDVMKEVSETFPI